MQINVLTHSDKRYLFPCNMFFALSSKYTFCYSRFSDDYVGGLPLRVTSSSILPIFIPHALNLFYEENNSKTKNIFSKSSICNFSQSKVHGYGWSNNEVKQNKKKI